MSMVVMVMMVAVTVPSMMMTVVIVTIVGIPVIISLILDLLLEVIPQNCTAQSPKETMFLLMSHVVSRCAACQSSAKATLSFSGARICLFFHLDFRVRTTRWHRAR